MHSEVNWYDDNLGARRILLDVIELKRENRIGEMLVEFLFASLSKQIESMKV